MSNPENIIKANLVIENIPENACFETFIELLKAIPQYMSVAIPETITNVIVSNIQPNSSQTTSVWFRLSNAGTFLGIYVFSSGQWNNIYPINDGNQIQIETFVSIDGTVPDGWTKIAVGDPLLPPAVVTDIVAGDVMDPTNTFEQKFSAYFSGF
jgi:hypothetical protein